MVVASSLLSNGAAVSPVVTPVAFSAVLLGNEDVELTPSVAAEVGFSVSLVTVRLLVDIASGFTGVDVVVLESVVTTALESAHFLCNLDSAPDVAHAPSWEYDVGSMR